MARNQQPAPTVELPDGTHVTLPTRWAICDNCRGDGHHAKALGVINPEDWEPDELDDYFAGHYDRPCECCGGSGKVREVDEGAADPVALSAYREEQRAAAEVAAEEAAERRALGYY